MTTSGTYAWNPAAAEMFAVAFGMCGVRRPAITSEHIADAIMHANLALVDFSNRNPNQWMLETIPIVLSPGVPSYTLPNRTLAVGAAYVSVNSGGTVNDRLMTAMSATEYAAVPEKGRQGYPNSYWLNLATPAPTITLFYVPDSNYTYTLQLTSFRQAQDFNPINDQTVDAPYRFLDAYVHGLASRLSTSYPDPKRPNLAAQYDGMYEKKMLIASEMDQEDVNMYVVPGMQGYFRALPLFLGIPGIMEIIPSISF
jgi:hypothetical protein